MVQGSAVRPFILRSMITSCWCVCVAWGCSAEFGGCRNISSYLRRPRKSALLVTSLSSSNVQPSVPSLNEREETGGGSGGRLPGIKSKA